MSLKEYTKKLQIMVGDEVQLAECLFLGWGCSLVGRCTKPWVLSPVPHKPNMAVPSIIPALGK